MRPLVITIEQFFPYPVDRAFAWLTDIDDDDVSRADARTVAARKVVERSDKRIVFEGGVKFLGRVIPSRTEVEFAPPDRWFSRVVGGPRKGSENDYRLTPAPGGSKLLVKYSLVSNDAFNRFVFRVAPSMVRREVAKMWANYAESMRAEFEAKGVSAQSSSGVTRPSA